MSEKITMIAIGTPAWKVKHNFTPTFQDIKQFQSVDKRFFDESGQKIIDGWLASEKNTEKNIEKKSEEAKPNESSART